MIRQVFLVWVLASILSLLIHSDDVAVSNGQVTGEYYGVNDSVIVARTNDMIPQNLQDVYRFDAENGLNVDTTSLLNQTLDFIVVYQNEPGVLLEWCYPSEIKCRDRLEISFGKDAVFSFNYKYGDSFYFEYRGQPTRLNNGECAKIRTTVNGEFDLLTNDSTPLSEFKLDARSFPLNQSLTQLAVRFEGSTCGAVVKFPKVFLVYSDSGAISSSSSPEPKTFSSKSPTNVSNGGSNGTTSTISASSSGMTTWEYLAIIGGSVLGVIFILVIVGVIFCLCRRRRRNRKVQKKSSKSGIKVIKLRGTRSMDSVMASAVPAAAPPSKDVKTAPTQPSATQLSLAKLHAEPTQPSESAVTAAEKTGNLGVDEKRNLGPAATLEIAEERTQDLSEELDLLQTGIPLMVVDPSKPFAKVFAADFTYKNVKKGTKEDTIYPEPKLTPFLTKVIVDKSAPPTQYTPDCLVHQAIRMPHVEERAALLYQAAVQANNQLYELGFRRNMAKYCVSGPAASEEWLKKVEGAEFLRFIVGIAVKPIIGKYGHYEEDTKLWKKYLLEIDVPECFRQACLMDQSTERRQFFTLATYYKMGMIMNNGADEKLLQKLPYPIPMMLDLAREAPHYFDIDYTVSTEATGPQ